MQNFVVISHTVRAHVSPLFLGGGRCGPMDGAVVDVAVGEPQETRYTPPHVITPNSVAIGQTVWAYVWVSPKF